MSSHAFWTDRLSDHLDGLLPPSEADAVDAHLATCADCRTVRDELEEVRRRAQALGGMEPPRDLWQGIRDRLDRDDDVVDLTLHLDVPREAPTKSRFESRSLLRAAAMVGLLLVTGASGWALRGLNVAETPVDSALGPTETLFGSMASTEGTDALGDEVATLEALLASAPESLDAETVSVLRNNLLLIQRAVAESRAALDRDPDNSYVRSHLEGAIARQAAFVQQASQILAGDD